MGWVGIFAAICLSALVFGSEGNECTVKSTEQILAGYSEVDHYIKRMMIEQDITGLSLAVRQEEKLLLAYEYGDARVQPLFQAASISKPLAAFGAMKLVETGKLSLNTPLSKFVLKPWLPPQEYTELVTLKTVLNHTSGLENDVTGDDRKIYFKPGTDYSYSGAGFLYLQQAMEDTTKKDFNSVMVDHMKRLGMEKSTFQLDYEGEHYVSAAFSLVSNPKELTLFFKEFSKPTPENRWVVSQMTTPTVESPENFRRVGLGVRLSPCKTDTAIYHTGRNFMFHHSASLVYQKSGLVITVMARGNDSRGVPSELVERILGGVVP